MHPLEMQMKMCISGWFVLQGVWGHAVAHGCAFWCCSAATSWNQWLFELAFLLPPASLPPLTSDPWHQPGVFLHTAAAHWILSLFESSSSLQTVTVGCNVKIPDATRATFNYALITPHILCTADTCLSFWNDFWAFFSTRIKLIFSVTPLWIIKLTCIVVLWWKLLLASWSESLSLTHVLWIITSFPLAFWPCDSGGRLQVQGEIFYF